MRHFYAFAVFGLIPLTGFYLIYMAVQAYF